MAMWVRIFIFMLDPGYETTKRISIKFGIVLFWTKFEYVYFQLVLDHSYLTWSIYVTWMLCSLIVHLPKNVRDIKATNSMERNLSSVPTSFPVSQRNFRHSTRTTCYYRAQNTNCSIHGARQFHKWSEAPTATERNKSLPGYQPRQLPNDKSRDGSWNCFIRISTIWRSWYPEFYCKRIQSTHSHHISLRSISISPSNQHQDFIRSGLFSSYLLAKMLYVFLLS